MNTDDVFFRALSVKLQVTVVIVDYRSVISSSCSQELFEIYVVLGRLAPENPFPTGLNDSYDALRWVRPNTNTTSHY